MSGEAVGVVLAVLLGIGTFWLATLCLRDASTCATLVLSEPAKENKMEKLPAYNPKTDTALGAALAFHEYLTECGTQAEKARKQRDALIVQAYGSGVTAYRIAQALGVAESTIGRIVHRSKA